MKPVTMDAHTFGSAAMKWAGLPAEFDPAVLLGQKTLQTDFTAEYVAGKTVLVSGAGGSIGMELTRQLAALHPAKLVLLDCDDTHLHRALLHTYGDGLFATDNFALCNIRDFSALAAVFEQHQPELVFHAAALKHLPVLESFPSEGWKTNVLGSANLLCLAQRYGVQRFVNISTDKAADPSSVLGRTKRLAERLTAWYAQCFQVPYVSVRFGNVLGSRGSVLTTFCEQIASGQDLTITHPDVSRFFMTTPQACALVLQAVTLANPGDALVLDMGEPIKIVDIAQRLIELTAANVGIRFTGLRPGEKLCEVLFSASEKQLPTANPRVSRVQVQPFAPQDLPLQAPDAAAFQRLLSKSPSACPSASSTN